MIVAACSLASIEHAQRLGARGRARDDLLAWRASTSSCVGLERRRRPGRRRRPCRRPCARSARGRARPRRPPARSRTPPAPSRRRSARPCPRGRRAWRTSSSSPVRVRIFLRLRDDAADRDPLAVLALVELARAARRPSACSASRTCLSGCAEMNRPIDSFSIASSSCCSNSSGGIGGCDGRGERRGGAVAVRRRRPPRVEDRALADLRVLLGLLPGGLRLLEHGEHALARRAGRAERAALDQRLDRLLVDRAAGRRARRSPRATSNGPPSSRAALIASTALRSRRPSRRPARSGCCRRRRRTRGRRGSRPAAGSRSPSPRSARRRTGPCPWSPSPSRSAPPCTRRGSWPSATPCGRRSARSRRRGTC